MENMAFGPRFINRSVLLKIPLHLKKSHSFDCEVGNDYSMLSKLLKMLQVNILRL